MPEADCLQTAQTCSFLVQSPQPCERPFHPKPDVQYHVRERQLRPITCPSAQASAIDPNASRSIPVRRMAAPYASCRSGRSKRTIGNAQHFSHCRRAIIHPEADASTNLGKPSAANVKLNGPQTGRVQGTFEWQLKHWVAVVWIEATSPSSCSRLYRERDRPRMTPKSAGTIPSYTTSWDSIRKSVQSYNGLSANVQLERQSIMVRSRFPG